MVPWAHVRLQSLLCSWFDQHEDEWGIIGDPGARTQVSATSVRLPDVVKIPAGPSPQTLVDAPLIVIEILSPSDTHSEIEARMRDYVEMGVPNVWMIGLQQRIARVCHGSSCTEVTRFTVENSPIYVDVPAPALFARLDKYGR